MEPGKIVSVFAYQPATEVTSNRVMFETYPQQHAKKQYSFALGEQNSSHLWRDDPSINKQTSFQIWVEIIK